VFLQALVAAQNRRIDQLVEKIKQQQDKLEKQSRHLQTLQLKVSLQRREAAPREDAEPSEPTGRRRLTLTALSSSSRSHTRG